MNIMSFIKQQTERLFPPKRIRLAVVGAPTSGKSFLLKDIIDALGCLGYATYESSRLTREDGFHYNDFINYSPNQSGGNGRTNTYACRHNDHYEQRCVSEQKFDLDFLNIPGEIFTPERLKCYNELKGELNKGNKFFVVCTYVNKAGDRRLIVEPKNDFSTLNDEIRKSINLQSRLGLVESFSTWEGIFAELNVGTYELKGWRALSGRELLKNFFRYDTDSVMRSIADLIEKRQITSTQINDVTDFIEGKHIQSFVFFHYCALATDIVVCDRVFAPKDDGNVEITFSQLSGQLRQFLNTESHATNVHVYLALRNIDYLLNKPEVEGAYQDLLTELKNSDWAKEKADVAWRNALYSLFTYAILCHAGLMTDDVQKRHKMLGIPENLAEGLPSDVNKLIERFLAIDESQKFVFNGGSAREHVISRIGGNGKGFRGLLQQTGWERQEKASLAVPHVHFTCTPVTEEFKVYKNKLDSTGQQTPEFYRDGETTPFSELNSNMCYGSLQLCIDILKQHKLGDGLPMGDLLVDIFDLRD